MFGQVPTFDAFRRGAVVAEQRHFSGMAATLARHRQTLRSAVRHCQAATGSVVPMKKIVPHLAYPIHFTDTLICSAYCKYSSMPYAANVKDIEATPQLLHWQ
jgi:hypothetical protein